VFELLDDGLPEDDRGELGGLGEVVVRPLVQLDERPTGLVQQQRVVIVRVEDGRGAFESLRCRTYADPNTGSTSGIHGIALP
jgi:hypothetical protein